MLTDHVVTADAAPGAAHDRSRHSHSPLHRRDINAQLDRIKASAVTRTAVERQRLADRLRADAEAISPRPAPRRKLAPRLDLCEVVTDALVPLDAEVKVWLELPERAVPIRGDQAALTALLLDLATGQAAERDRLWVSVRSDRTGARVTICGNGRVDQVSSLCRLLVARTGGHIVPLGDALTVLLPRGGAV